MSATIEQCSNCGAAEIVVKKFTLPAGDDRNVTVLDYFCPTCGQLDTIDCGKAGWHEAVDRWARPTAESTDPWLAAARDRGPIATKQFRVVVSEASGEMSVKDFSSEEEATTYADDAASETDDLTPIAKVFDKALRLIYSGRPWWTRKAKP